MFQLLFYFIFLEHVEDITSAVFQYIAMLRAAGPQKWIFQECSV